MLLTGVSSNWLSCMFLLLILRIYCYFFVCLSVYFSFLLFFFVQATNTAGIYLEYDDVRMESVRNEFSRIRTEQGISLCLILNFDQVWKQSYSAPQRLWHHCGNLDARQTRFGRKAAAWKTKLVEDIKEKLTRELNPETQHATPQKKRRAKATPVRAEAVENARHSVTMVTSTWASGEPGPIAICIANGFLSGKEIQELNDSFGCRAFFVH